MRVFNNVFAEDQPMSVYHRTDADIRAESNVESVDDKWKSLVGHAALTEEVQVQPQPWEEFGLTGRQQLA